MSTFTFTEPFSKPYLGKDNKYSLTIAIRLFPEKNMTTVVYDVKYQPLRDELTKQDVFSSKHAEDIRKDYIKTISQVFSSNSK